MSVIVRGSLRVLIPYSPKNLAFRSGFNNRLSSQNQRRESDACDNQGRPKVKMAGIPHLIGNGERDPSHRKIGKRLDFAIRELKKRNHQAHETGNCHNVEEGCHSGALKEMKAFGGRPLELANSDQASPYFIKSAYSPSYFASSFAE
ncbi:hypothetical protein G8O24_13320 [Bradyrhizobium sp. INPA01-394B]|uniref:Uncharacterized protein n=1 Tax=Bradyrhizobium campsiandrae TaxID=1729892 RepID=A0ABR7UE96_9BRAD|nr:hypothetical protein [Bradyrhizobium campsiandrae]MBC9878322.1 hypothetical protein [Bradyrhizobium campsiandrae]MBC9982404.1 hypothetical protein [Bradyrhizobium campsiandrae]